jgi:hypothetical protein
VLGSADSGQSSGESLAAQLQALIKSPIWLRQEPGHWVGSVNVPRVLTSVVEETHAFFCTFSKFDRAGSWSSDST